MNRLGKALVAGLALAVGASALGAIWLVIAADVAAGGLTATAARLGIAVWWSVAMG